MTKKLLVTDTFFISQKYVDQLTNAGYEVIRLDKAAATEDELIEALKGISVYIIGGIEQVTDKVLETTTELETIIFTGVDYSKFVPGFATAEKKGISILNAPGANAVGVAEFAVGVALTMQRQLLTISRNGSSKFVTTRSIQGSTVGIIGMGNIGSIILKAVQVFDPEKVYYYNRSPKGVEAEQTSLENLVSTSDIIFLTLPASAGQVLDGELLSKVKKDSLLISISPNTLIDYDALLLKLASNEIRAAIDWPSPSEAFDGLSLDSWLSFNSHSAYNTHTALDSVNASVTQTAIGLLNK
jgi:phosphoglycerate dehydrogenase-like enzyme